MAYSKESLKVFFELPPHLWEIVDAIATKKGYKTTRRYINAELRNISRKYSPLQKCAGKGDKKAVIYEIKEEYKDSIQNLSCLLGKSPAAILLVHLLPEILGELNQEPPPSSPTS